LSTVLNTARLLLLLGLGLFYFIGLGWHITELVLHKNPTLGDKKVSLFQIIPLTIILGFIFNYGISLVFQSLPAGLFVGAATSILGLWRFGWQVFRDGRLINSRIESLNIWLGWAVIYLLFLSPILTEPLNAWDARSIWFFHAKMIYTAGSFGPSAGWQHPSAAFSHVDYPNIIPGMASQVAYISGSWNEFLPKISLAFTLFPALMWLFTFARKTFSFAFLVMVFPFSIYTLIWNGYMDGYLALYLSISMLLLGRYVQQPGFIDLVSGMACLAFLPYLKNEGQLAVISGGFALLSAILFAGNGNHRDVRSHILNWRGLVAGLTVLLPFVAWGIYKHNLGVSNYLHIGTSQSIARMIERINDQSYRLITENTYQHIEVSMLLVGLLYFAASARKLPFPKPIIPPLITATIYCAGMVAVYLLTPLDLEWQLASSAGRTMLSVAGCIFVVCYFILESLELRSGTGWDERI